MDKATIKTWVRYWNSSKEVNFSEIGSLDDMAQARLFCQVLRVGLFAEVSDQAILDAWREVTREDKDSAHDAECEAAAVRLTRERGKKLAFVDPYRPFYQFPRHS
jgi:hypothetical protein